MTISVLQRLETLYLQEQARKHSELLLRAWRAGHRPLEQIKQHPLGEHWLDWSVRAAGQHLASRAGWVYVMANPAVSAQVVYKVGQTRVGPASRARALNTAGVLGTFEVLKAWPVSDRHWVEAQAHRALRLKGPSHKEFFQVPWNQVFAVVEGLAQQDEARLAGFALSRPPG